MSDTVKLSAVEGIKRESHGLRGGLEADLAAGGTQVTEESYNLLKFHGSYEQYDRDTATARKQAGEEKEYQFMVRVRCPGGRMTAAQYLDLDRLADDYANGTLRITTRQGIQFHGIVKDDLKASVAAINEALLTSYAACGDVVRNVMTTPAPRADAIHRRLDADAKMLSDALLPASRAYYQIFLGEEAGATDETEMLYGPTYLPRKFKIGLAHAADNTPDVLTNDLGFIAVFEGDTLIGYNVAAGGGLGMTHNKPKTFPRIASIVGSVGPGDLLAAAKAVISLHRDHGDRGDRKRARLKYVVADRGVPWVTETLRTQYALDLRDPLPTPPLEVPELLGWHAQGDRRFWLGVPVPSGRIGDEHGIGLRTALREIVQEFDADPIFTPQQDVLLSNLHDEDRAEIEAILREHNVPLSEDLSPVSRWALACPALPTCGLALTEAERVRGPLVAQVEQALARQDLAGERVSVRITGCPNGCARPYAGDIGLVGRIPGFYALYVGGDFAGTRLSEKLVERVPEAAIGTTLEPLFAAFRTGRQPGEGFGDFCFRAGNDNLLKLLTPREAAE